MGWTFYITATNNTGHDLTCTSHHLKWGYWYRDSKDKSAPLGVLKADGVPRQILGIRAAKGTWTGYECTAQWSDNAPTTTENPNMGSMSISIDVPYMEDERNNTLTTSGLMQVEGWDAKAFNQTGKHVFDAHLSIDSPLNTVAHKGVTLQSHLVYEEDDAVALELDAEFAIYQSQLQLDNPMPEHWAQVEQLKQVEQFEVLKELPKTLSLTQRMVARSAPTSIAKDLWSAIVDAKFPDVHSKKIGVAEYFHVAIYSVGTDPRCWVSLPKMASEEVTCSVVVESQLRHTISKTSTIAASINGSSKDKTSELTASLNASFTYADVTEQVVTRREEKVTKKTLRAPDDKDVVFTPWVAGAGMLLYRRDVKGRIELIGVSDWLQSGVIWKTYDQQDQLRLQHSLRPELALA